MTEEERLIRKEELPEETSYEAIKSTESETAEISFEILPNRLVTPIIITTISQYKLIEVFNSRTSYRRGVNDCSQP